MSTAPFSASIAFANSAVKIHEFSAISTSVGAENAPLSRLWIQCERELELLGQYRDDWDGMGARGTSLESFNAAVRFLQKLKAEKERSLPPVLSVAPTGHVVMEWRSLGEYIEAEFNGSEEVEWMEKRNGATRQWSVYLLDSDRALVTGAEDWAWFPSIANSTAQRTTVFG